MLDENDVLVTQLRRVVAQNGKNVAREGLIIGWWLGQFATITPPRAKRHHTYLPNKGAVCQCEMCKWQRGEKDWR